MSFFRVVALWCFVFLPLASDFCTAQGTYTEWSLWSSCQPECGAGIQERTRTCNGPSCRGASRQTTSCSTRCGCDRVPCNNGGTCIQDAVDPKAYLCICPPGFTGNGSQDCSTVIPQQTKVLTINPTTPTPVQSAFYPSPYSILTRTTWLLTTSQTNTLSLDFRDFNIGPGNSSSSCTDEYNTQLQFLQSNGVDFHRFSPSEVSAFCPCVHDVVLVYQGNSTALADLLYTFCNANPPVSTQLDTSQTTLTVVFQSDQLLNEESGNSTGFWIDAIAKDDPCECRLRGDPIVENCQNKLWFLGPGDFDLSVSDDPSCPYSVTINNGHFNDDANELVVTNYMEITQGSNSIRIYRDHTISVNSGAAEDPPKDLSWASVSKNDDDFVLVELKGCEAKFQFWGQSMATRGILLIPSNIINSGSGRCHENP